MESSASHGGVNKKERWYKGDDQSDKSNDSLSGEFHFLSSVFLTEMMESEGNISSTEWGTLVDLYAVFIYPFFRTHRRVVNAIKLPEVGHGLRTSRHA